MNGEKWSKEHKEMLKTDMTNVQIAKETGRTLEAVKRARYTYTGHAVEKDRWVETKEERLFEMEKKVHKLQKEQRLLDLCRHLGVRIGG